MYLPIDIYGLPWWLSDEESACIAGDTGVLGSIPGSGRPLEEVIAAHSSILAWRIPWTKKPGRLLSTVPNIQSNITRHMKMQENMIYSQENRNRFRDNTLEIADKDFKTPIINMFKNFSVIRWT